MQKEQLRRRDLRGLMCFGAAAALMPSPAWACAACYGQSDSPLAQGMNWGILSLLGMVALVLSGIAVFFFYLARRAAASAPGAQAGELSGSVNRA